MGKVLDRQDTWKGSAWQPWTQNLYTYVGNNPVNLIDPTGHCGVHPDGATYTKDCSDWDKVLIGLIRDKGQSEEWDNLAKLIIQQFADQIDPYWTYQSYGWDNTDYEFWVVRDRTEEFTAELWSNAREAAEHSSDNLLDKMKWFAGMVPTGGEWDLKSKPFWRRRHTIINGEMYNGEDLGNIHYGYVGRAAGFSPGTLLGAAGAYQVVSGTWRAAWYGSNFDDPRDQAMIDMGINWYAGDFSYGVFR